MNYGNLLDRIKSEFFDWKESQPYDGDLTRRNAAYEQAAERIVCRHAKDEWKVYETNAGWSVAKNRAELLARKEFEWVELLPCALAQSKEEAQERAKSIGALSHFR